MRRLSAALLTRFRDFLLTTSFIVSLLLTGCGSEVVFQPMTASEVSAAAPAERLRAKELQERFRVTPHAANEQLAGKVVEVTGQIQLLGRAESGEGILKLVGGHKGRNPIVCLLSDPHPWWQVAPGMVVTVKGQVQKIPPKAIPTLLHAEITGVDESLVSGVRIDATALCREYHQSHPEAQSRYLERWVWVTGVISSVDRVNEATYLEGAEGLQVRCSVGKAVPELPAELVRGSRVTILGKVQGTDRRKVLLSDCLPAFPGTRGEGAPEEAQESSEPMGEP